MRNRSTGGWGWGGRESRAHPSYPVSIRYTRYGVGIRVNVPLFKKLRDIFFFAGQSLYEPFQGTF
jgi:hypothetical protein